MTTDLDAAAARLKRDLDAIAAETSGAKEARGDVRLLLADWERLREEESKWSLASQAYLSDAKAAEAERDAARAEVERLRAELGQVTGDPESTSNRRVAAAVGELACLRERGAKVSLTLQRGLAGAITQGKRASVRLDWCVHAVKEALELLKETP